jgi:hypothetical protein
MAKAEYIGIEKIVKLLNDNPPIKLELKKGGKVVYIDQKLDHDTYEDVINRFLNRFAYDQPETNFATYSFEISTKKPGSKLASKICPDISFNPPPGGEYINPYKKKEMSTSMSGEMGFTAREFIEATTRAHILEDENNKLRAELESLEAENEELESKIPEGEQPQNIGAVLQNALYTNADKIIAILADKLFGAGSNPTMGLAGIPDNDVQSLLNQMILIEPEFPEHLQMLINLRINKPAIYSMALGQLKSL